MNKSKLTSLFQKYMNSADPAEIDEFLLLIQDYSDEEILALLEKTFYESNTNRSFFSEEKSQALLQTVFNSEELPIEHTTIEPYVLRNQKTQWLSYIAIAASLLIAITIGVAVHIDEKNDPIQLVNIDHEIKPGDDKATLELADGTLINLNPDLKGDIFEKDGLVISKTNDGQIIYNTINAKRKSNSPIPYNTIRTPKGGQFRIVLPDGSNVWLNAASSLTYPEVFDGEERKVELHGEGYFEVAKNKDVPFKVLSGGQTVMVLGTQFNINSYEDEPLIKTTLVEGSVKITNNLNKSAIVLSPGEQASFDESNQFSIVNDDVANAIAWKNGFFRFRGAEIGQVLREFSRWYDVDIEIEEKNKGLEFWGEIYRNASITDALEIMSYFNLHYKIEQTKENKKIIIF